MSPFFVCWGILDSNEKTETKYRYETETVTEPKVYVTTYGEKYHHISCSYLKSMHEKGRTEAIKEGYTACSRCGGRSSGTILVSYQKRVAYEVEKNNALTAIPIALLVGSVSFFGIKSLMKRHEDTE